MARPRKKLKILLIEPNYSNKYPPIGLMKLSTYHKMLGHEVVFYKGDLKQFVIERIANKCIDEFYKIDENINWNLYKDLFVEYIRTRRRDFLVQIPISSTNMEILLTNKRLNPVYISDNQNLTISMVMIQRQNLLCAYIDILLSNNSCYKDNNNL